MSDKTEVSHTTGIRRPLGSPNSLRFAGLLAGLLITGCDVRDSDNPPSATANGSAAIGETAGDDPATFKFIPPDLSEQEIRDGWISLFDGVSLFGWNAPDSMNWRVEDNCLVADGDGKGLLTTPFKYDDFEFRCDFHLASGGNSGVFLRTAANAASPATDTYELNICDSHESFPTGSLVTRFLAEDVPPVEGEWHTFRVRCEDRRIQVWLDDAMIVNFTDNSENFRPSGTIGLQMNGGRVAFRKVFLRPLNGNELFDGQSLSGWSVVDGSRSEFTVADGSIHVKSGAGFLQTDSTHGDFILHVEARTNAPRLNSGVFFRAQPGTADAPSHGYEMQIHNGYENNNRTQPQDSGTGAIFRRAAARCVVANDEEWLTATLVAQGDQFATWVNGYQVVQWQDTREPDDNPRNGRRLAAGHLSLQGHDPTTDLDFRTVRIHDFLTDK